MAGGANYICPLIWWGAKQIDLKFKTVKDQQLHSNEVCSNILVLLVFFNAIFLLDRFFCLTRLTFRPQKRDKYGAPNGYYVVLDPFSSLVSKYAINRNCFGALIYGVEGGS